MTEAPRFLTMGLTTVTLLEGGDVELRRQGSPGHGRMRRELLWHRDQLEAAWIAAASRRGKDAQDEAKALRWALEETAHG